MQRTDGMRKFEDNKSLQSESVRSKSENGSIHDFAEDAYLQKLDSENSKDSKSENNPNFREQATLKKKSKPLNKTVDKKSSSNDRSLENKRGQDLCRKVDELREEKEALESECDRVQSSQKGNYKAVSNPLESPEKLESLLDEIKEKLKKEESLNKALKLNLRNTEKSNAELLLEAKDFAKKMEEKNTEIEGLRAELELKWKKKDEFKSHRKDVSRDYKFSFDYKIQREYSKSLSTVKQYELQVKTLEERVIQAEEALSEAKLTNATVVENLQDELKRVSVEMTSHVNEKEKLASHQNLQEAFDKSRQELSLTKDTYKQELSEMELESLRKPILKENKRVSSSQKHNYSNPLESPEKLKLLLDEMKEKLKKEKSLNKALSLDLRNTEKSNAEHFARKMEEKNTEIEGLCAELDLERKEKDELKIPIKEFSLDSKFSLNYKIQSEFSKSLSTVKQYELQVKQLEEMIVNLDMELSRSLDTISTLKTHIKKLDKELEKQGYDFKDDVEYLQEELDKSRQELSLTKDTYKQEAQELCDQLYRQAEQIKELSLNLEISKKHGESKEGATQEWIRERELLVTELASLKKETEKLQKESTSFTSLLSTKNDMIRALQSELKMISGDYNELKKRLLVIESDLQKEEIKVASEASSKHDESRSIFGSTKSIEGNDEEKLNKLLSEVSSLESELKEMQDKYSEVSLRFAEVEGERQQLVLALRNLCNGKK